MFEKEADEYAGENWQMIHRYQTNDRLAREQSFKDGADFGYNKAMNEIGYRMESAYREGVAFGKDKVKEEMQAQIEKMKCCHNCRKFHNLSYDCTCAEVCNEWELKEIKEK